MNSTAMSSVILHVTTTHFLLFLCHFRHKCHEKNEMSCRLKTEKIMMVDGSNKCRTSIHLHNVFKLCHVCNACKLISTQTKIFLFSKLNQTATVGHVTKITNLTSSFPANLKLIKCGWH